MRDQQSGAIDAWMDDLRAALGKERRVRAGRIADEAYEHLREASDELEAQGMSRTDAEQTAVDRLGSASAYASGFRGPTTADWSTDTARWLVPLAGVVLVAVGAALALIETIAWIVGADAVSARTVRVWRSCRRSIDGECVGGWDETLAAGLLVLGVALIMVGVGLTVAALVLRRRYSDLELVPRWLRRTARGLLGGLGATLVIGGAARSALDGSWRWVPVWLPVGVLCVAAALLTPVAQQRDRFTG